MTEILDIYDANFNHIGTAERDKAHREGLWHQTYHLWLVSTDSEPKLLFQLRSNNVAVNPNLLDASVAGHLGVGELLSDGIREVKEELGVTLMPSAIHFMGYRTEVCDFQNGIKNREFQGIHIAESAQTIADFQPDHQEVAGLYHIGVSACLDLFSGVSDSAPTTGILYDYGSCLWKYSERNVSPGDFIQRVPPYYLTVAIMAERFVNNQFPLAIS